MGSTATAVAISATRLNPAAIAAIKLMISVAPCAEYVVRSSCSLPTRSPCWTSHDDRRKAEASARRLSATTSAMSAADCEFPRTPATSRSSTKHSEISSPVPSPIRPSTGISIESAFSVRLNATRASTTRNAASVTPEIKLVKAMPDNLLQRPLTNSWIERQVRGSSAISETAVRLIGGVAGVPRRT